MNKNQLELLEKRTRKIGEALFNWKDSKSTDKSVSMKDFIEKLNEPLPNQITEQGKGNINISLHKSSFNNIEHFHNYYEIIYVIKGELINLIGNNSITLKENECIIQFPGTKHSIISFDDTKSIAINITINKDFFTHSYYKALFESTNFFVKLDEPSKREYIVSKELNLVTKKIIGILLDIFFNDEEYSQLSFENVLVLLLMEMLKNNLIKEDEFTSKLNNYINKNITTITLCSAADYFGYHSKYFSSLVKKKTGKSFIDILIEKRINKGAYYLMYTNYSNTKICELIGYDNYLSFYANFKKHYGVSPSEYRSRNKVR